MTSLKQRQPSCVYVIHALTPANTYLQKRASSYPAIRQWYQFYWCSMGVEKGSCSAKSQQNPRNIPTGFNEMEFQPPSSFTSWWAVGACHKNIRTIRRTLTWVLRKHTLHNDCFHTVLCEVEAILNDRPITKSFGDPNNLEALTPNHLLTVKGKLFLPPGLFHQTDLYIKRIWIQTQSPVDLFWKQWLKEYLPFLQEHQKWTRKRHSFFPGDTELVADPTAPCGSWPLGNLPRQMVCVWIVSALLSLAIWGRCVGAICLFVFLWILKSLMSQWRSG